MTRTIISGMMMALFMIGATANAAGPIYGPIRDLHSSVRVFETVLCQRTRRPDLRQASKDLVTKACALVELAKNHASNDQLCRAFGFVEACRRDVDRLICADPYLRNDCVLSRYWRNTQSHIRFVKRLLHPPQPVVPQLPPQAGRPSVEFSLQIGRRPNIRGVDPRLQRRNLPPTPPVSYGGYGAPRRAPVGLSHAEQQARRAELIRQIIFNAIR